MICTWCGMKECPYSTGDSEPEPAEVVSADDMDNDIFLKHMDARHGLSVKWGPLSTHPDRADEWIQPYRAFHDRLHEVHEDHIDHIHLW